LQKFNIKNTIFKYDTILKIMEITQYEPLENDQLFAFLQINLPPDIKRKIYEEYFKVSIIYNKKYSILMGVIISDECHSLNPTSLKPLVETIIQKPKFLAYVCARNDLFSRLYKSHYIDGNKHFKNLDELTSISLAWLMYLYH